MIALDTNLLVRLATGDEPQQAEKIARLLESERCLIPITVTLETEWVLRSLYAYQPNDFADFVDFLLAHPNALMTEAESLMSAIQAHRAGLDFADALHASIAAGATMITLDKAFVKRATALGLEVQPLK